MPQHRNANRSTGTTAALAAFWLLLPALVGAQQPEDAADLAPADAPDVAQQVDVGAVTPDAAIAERLSNILAATGWYSDTQVRVDQGVVFLNARVEDEAHRDWAGRLATNTEDVVAVVNRIEVIETSPWDLSPTWESLRDMVAGAVRASPLILIALLLLVSTWFAARWTTGAARIALRQRLRSGLLRDVVSRAAAIPVFVIGLYVVLQILGLTGLAVTVIGGTGLLGLVIGFAFRDIAENFLASILLSVQRPFAINDVIQVAGYTGFVQSVNMRCTLLMTLNGNHVQIPNAIVYKETITNLTANPNSRFDFAVGIGSEDSITEAQSVALSVLQSHEAVLEDPEPLVLVESLGAATVNLRIYFWVDIRKFSQVKVSSAIIRLVKQALDDAGVSMPDEAREVIFPSGVPVRMLSDADVAEEAEKRPRETREQPQPEVSQAEGDLASEAAEIGRQARKSRAPEGGRNLLE